MEEIKETPIYEKTKKDHPIEMDHKIQIDEKILETKA